MDRRRTSGVAATSNFNRTLDSQTNPTKKAPTTGTYAAAIASTKRELALRASKHAVSNKYGKQERGIQIAKRLSRGYDQRNRPGSRVHLNASEYNKRKTLARDILAQHNQQV